MVRGDTVLKREFSRKRSSMHPRNKTRFAVVILRSNPKQNVRNSSVTTSRREKSKKRGEMEVSEAKDSS